MKVHIRTALVSDIAALVDLLAVLFTQEHEFSPDARRQACGLELIIRQEEVGIILLAEDDTGQILGMVNILFTVSTALGQRVALLEDMIVTPEMRDGGVGSRLIQQAISVARARGCGRVTVLTDGDNLVAQGFYRKHGFAKSGMLGMRLML